MLCLSTSYADCIRYCADTGYLITLFASARPTRIASACAKVNAKSTVLCLSTSYADCIAVPLRDFAVRDALPQHVLRGLHRTQQERLSKQFAFASARPTRIASRTQIGSSGNYAFASARPTRIASGSAQNKLDAVAFASARPTRIASAKTHKVRLAFMTDGAVSR